MNESVLITGASGFVGQNCLRRFVADGYKVHAVAASRIGRNAPGIAWHRSDLHDSNQVALLASKARAGTLLHLAWNVKPNEVYTSPENYRWVASSMELVRRFVEQGGRRVIVAGTCYEYGQNHAWRHEQRTPLEPTTVYGVCKNALRQMLAHYCRAEQISFAWPRVFFLYGPHEDPRRLCSSVVVSLLQGRRAECSHGRQLRDYLYVEDLADALVRLCGSDVREEINLGSGAPVSVAELVQEIGRQLGRPELIALGALPARPSEAPLIAADITRQREELGFRPRHSLHDAIGNTIAWWRTQLQEI